jgi:serine phosphatase RsbU (regulator of sigma subunit)
VTGLSSDDDACVSLHERWDLSGGRRRVGSEGSDVVPWLRSQAERLGAAAAVLALMTPDGLALEPVWWMGYPEELIDSWRRVSLSLSAPLTDALRGDPVIVSSAAGLSERYPFLESNPLSGCPVMAAVAVCDATDRRIGVLGFSFSASVAVNDADLQQVAAALAQRFPDGPADSGDVGSRLQELSRAFLAATDVEQVLDVLVARAQLLLGAEMVVISTLDESTGTLQMVRGRTPADVHVQSISDLAGVPLLARDALATGAPVLLRSIAERDLRYPTLAGVGVQYQSVAALALRSDHRDWGVVEFGWGRPQKFPTSQVAVLEQVGALCAAALASAHQQANEKAARLRLEQATTRLQELITLTRQLALATLPDDVASVVIDLARRALGADAATLTAYDGHRPAVHLAARGLPGVFEGEPRMRRGQRPAFEQLALVQDLLRSRRPVLVSSFADRNARYPDMANNQVTQQAWANLPLVLGERFVGLASFGWNAPRTFTDDDVAFLEALADHAAIALERVELLTASRSVAETMQHSLLPAALPATPRFTFAARYQPARHLPVGGDWYDVVVLSSSRVAVVVGDVVGHGAAAAAVMGQLRSALTSCLLDGYSPRRALEHLDRFARRVPGARASSVACMLADADRETLTVAHAGHLPALLLDATGTRYLGHATGPVLGVAPQPRYAQRRVRLMHGASVLLYTDGLIERRDEDIDTGLARLADTLTTARDAAPDSIASTVLDAALAAGAGDDDIALICTRLHQGLGRGEDGA